MRKMFIEVVGDLDKNSSSSVVAEESPHRGGLSNERS